MNCNLWINSLKWTHKLIKHRKLWHFHYYIDKQSVSTAAARVSKILAWRSSNYFDLHWYELIAFQLYVFLATTIITTNTARPSGVSQNTYRLTWKTDYAIWFSSAWKGLKQQKSREATSIVQIGSGEFSVISHTNNPTRYRVSFWNEKNMPYCTYFFMEKVMLHVQTFFRCVSGVSKLVLGCIFSFVCRFSLSSTWHLEQSIQECIK